MDKLIERMSILTAEQLSRRRLLKIAGAATGATVGILTGLFGSEAGPASAHYNCVSCAPWDWCSCGPPCSQGCYCCCDHTDIGCVGDLRFCGGFIYTRVTSYITCYNAFSCCQCQTATYGPFSYCSAWCHGSCNACDCAPYTCSC